MQLIQSLIIRTSNAFNEGLSGLLRETICSPQPEPILCLKIYTSHSLLGGREVNIGEEFFYKGQSIQIEWLGSITLEINLVMRNMFQVSSLEIVTGEINSKCPCTGGINK